MNIEPIAYIENDFVEKFGIPRQSGILEQVLSKIVMEPKYRDIRCVRELSEFDYIWLLWDFCENHREHSTSLQVRPPRLGGNKKVGVFATRSPFRPNPIGLSCVKLCEIKEEERGPILYVAGADLMNGTPIFDIKPYVAYTDAHPQARSGFADEVKEYRLEVSFPEKLAKELTKQEREIIAGILAQDPRPGYKRDENREYGVSFGKWNIRFVVTDNIANVRSLTNRHHTRNLELGD